MSMVFTTDVNCLVLGLLLLAESYALGEILGQVLALSEMDPVSRRRNLIKEFDRTSN